MVLMLTNVMFGYIEHNLQVILIGAACRRLVEFVKLLMVAKVLTDARWIVNPEERDQYPLVTPDYPLCGGACYLLSNK